MAATRRLPSLGNLMLIGMGVGVAAGILFGESATRAAFLGDIFIRLLTLVAVPLVFFNLIGALASSGASGGVSRLLLRIGTFFALTTVAAQLVALAVIGVLRPGAGLAPSEGGEPGAGPTATPGFEDFLFTMVPDNAFRVFVDDRVTAVVVLGLMVGFATWGLDRERRADVTRFFASGTALLRQLVSGVLWFGPVGVAALAAASVGEYGSSIFGPLGVYIAAVWIADVAIFALYFAALRFLAATSPLSFVRRTATVWTTTVSTCSSLASLGASLNAAEKMGLPRSSYALTLPLGAQFNKDGSAVLLCRDRPVHRAGRRSVVRGRGTAGADRPGSPLLRRRPGSAQRRAGEPVPAAPRLRAAGGNRGARRGHLPPRGHAHHDRQHHG